MSCEAVCVNGGGRHDDREVRAARQELTQIAEQKINVQAALMRFVNDDAVVSQKVRIGLRLGQQDAIRHQLDLRVFRQLVGKADFKTDHFAKRRVQFVRNALGDAGCGNAARLRVRNDLGAISSLPRRPC